MRMALFPVERQRVSARLAGRGFDTQGGFAQTEEIYEVAGGVKWVMK